MQKIVLLLIALTIASWARTWEDAETLNYYTQFEDDSLDTFYSTEKIQGLYFYIEFEGNDDSMGVLREYHSLFMSGMTQTMRGTPSGSRNTGWTTACVSRPSSWTRMWIGTISDC